MARLPFGGTSGSGGLANPLTGSGLTELESIPVVDDTFSTLQNAVCIGNEVILPATFDYFVITAVEWKNHTTINGNVIAGVALLEETPPATNTLMTILAQTPITAQAGVSAVQKVAILGYPVVAKGTRIVGFVGSNSATGNFRLITTALQNIIKAITFPTLMLPWNNTTAWTTSTVMAYCKIYFRGIKFN